MASRVFDTYIPGSEEHLVSFINFINNGRVLCMAVQVSRSCQEGRAHREGRGELTGREGKSSPGGKGRAHREDLQFLMFLHLCRMRAPSLCTTPAGMQ